MFIGIKTISKLIHHLRPVLLQVVSGIAKLYPEPELNGKPGNYSVLVEAEDRGFPAKTASAVFLVCVQVGSAVFLVCVQVGSAVFLVCVQVVSTVFLVCVQVGFAVFQVFFQVGSTVFLVCVQVVSAVFVVCVQVGSAVFLVCVQVGSAVFLVCVQVGSAVFLVCVQVGSAVLLKYENIQDFNDHAPEFILPSSNYTVRILENATIGIFYHKQTFLSVIFYIETNQTYNLKV